MQSLQQAIQNKEGYNKIFNEQKNYFEYIKYLRKIDYQITLTTSDQYN